MVLCYGQLTNKRRTLKRMQGGEPMRHSVFKVRLRLVSKATRAEERAFLIP